MKKIHVFIYLLILFCYSCNNKTNHSFSSLNKAFYNWYNKNHAINVHYLNKGFHFYNDIYYDDLYIEYLNDLKRFQLEFSQLDVSKINNSNLTKYYILEKLINGLIIVNSSENIKTDPYFILFDNYYSMYSIIEDKNLMMNDKIYLLFEKINKNIQNLNYVIENKKEYVLTDKNKFSIKTDIFLNYLNYIPIKVTSDLKTLDSLDYILNNLKVNFLKFKKNNLTINKIDSYDVLNNNKKIYQNLIDINVHNYNGYNDNLLELNDKFNYYNKKLFDLCINVYLIENDEPVWVDYKDTLNVIKWVVDNKINSNYLDKEKVISNYYKSLNQYDKSFDKINNKSMFKTLPTIFKKDEMLDLFDKNSFVSKNSIYVDVFHSMNNYNKYIIFNNLSYNLISSFYDENNINLNCLINDQSFQNGLSIYLRGILLSDEYYSNDKIYSILHYLDIIRLIILSKNQHVFFNEGLSEDEIVLDLTKHGFLDKKNALEYCQKIYSIDSIYILDYLYLNELILNDKKFNILNDIINKGTVPLHLINK